MKEAGISRYRYEVMSIKWINANFNAYCLKALNHGNSLQTRNKTVSFEQLEVEPIAAPYLIFRL